MVSSLLYFFQLSSSLDVSFNKTFLSTITFSSSIIYSFLWPSFLLRTSICMIISLFTSVIEFSPLSFCVTKSFSTCLLDVASFPISPFFFLWSGDMGGRFRLVLLSKMYYYSQHEHFKYSRKVSHKTRKLPQLSGQYTETLV